jgi:hypothetical protein
MGANVYGNGLSHDESGPRPPRMLAPGHDGVTARNSDSSAKMQATQMAADR